MLDLLSSAAFNQHVPKAQELLEQEFDRHQLAAERFPPSISPAVIRSAVDSFRQSLEIRAQRDICSSCGIFCVSSDTRRILDRDNCLNRLKEAGLDSCGYRDGCWSFCLSCYRDILSGRIPKFSVCNGVNVTMCDDYPVVLKDLTFVEECVIARRHPIGSILKLRPGNRRSPSNYYALRGHMVVVPQNPGPLLHILPSPDLRLQDIVKVFWMGKCQSSSDDLIPYLQIRKTRVLNALLWFVSHHQHYRDLTINYSLLSTWPETFIPSQISANITHVDIPDHCEREGCKSRQ